MTTESTHTTTTTSYTGSASTAKVGPSGPTQIPIGYFVRYEVDADKKKLPTDSIVVTVSDTTAIELDEDYPATAGIASGKLIALPVPGDKQPKTGIKVTAMMTHSGGTVLTDVATVDVVYPDPATKITLSLGQVQGPAT